MMFELMMCWIGRGDIVREFVYKVGDLFVRKGKVNNRLIEAFYYYFFTFAFQALTCCPCSVTDHV